MFNSSTEEPQHQHQESQKQRHGEQKNSGRKLRALIIEDDVDAVQLLQIVLLNFGFSTTLAFDGKDALKKLDGGPFDLVFLDIYLPEMNGMQVLSEIHRLRVQTLMSCQKWRPLPVITYSSCHTADFKIPDEQGFYIVGHWQKPVTLPQLTALTEKAVGYLGLGPF